MSSPENYQKKVLFRDFFVSISAVVLAAVFFSVILVVVTALGIAHTVENNAQERAACSFQLVNGFSHRCFRRSASANAEDRAITNIADPLRV